MYFQALTFDFFIRLAVNFISVFAIIRLVYYPADKENQLFRTFFIFNTIIFLITYFLSKVELSIGAAFSLFAVFSLLRFRTKGVTVKNMTYLFLVIAVGLLNAVIKGNIVELSIVNLLVFAIAYLVEDSPLMRFKENSKIIYFDNLDLIQPDKTELLIGELKIRTGLAITKVKIQEIDFLKKYATVIIYYKS